MCGDQKVSIIVPVFNVSKYLTECIESLINQTYKNIEIILIDDESTDNSLEICRSYARKDSRITVISKKNGGAASARNVGLNQCTGDYVCFVDSDDYVDCSYVQKLVKILECNKADIAVCNFKYAYKNRNVDINVITENKIVSQKNYLKQFLSDWTCGLIWNKLFKREVLGTIRFPEGRKIDDEFFTYQLVMNAKKIVLFNNSLYFYRIRSSSVMNKGIEYQELILNDRIDYTIERFESVIQRYPELYREYLIGLADSLIRMIRMSREIERCQTKIGKITCRYALRIIFSQIPIKNKYSFIYAVYCKKDKMKLDQMESNEKDEFFE